MGNRSAVKSCLKRNVKGNTLQRYVDYVVNLGGVTGFWPLQEASGDRRGYIGDQPLTDNATVTGGKGPHEGLAFASDFETANSEFLSAADANAYSFSGDMTGLALVSMESKPIGEIHIVSKDDVSTNREYTLRYQGSGGDRFQWFQGNADFSVLDNVVANNFGSPSLATWYMIEADINSVGGTIGLRVNNGTRDSATKTATMVNNAQALKIGAQGNTANFWDGLIASVLLVRRLLQRFESQNVYELALGRTP